MKKKEVFFSFYLIGEDSLAIDCVKLLLSRQWVCLGLISPIFTIQEWAKENNINYYTTIEEAKTDLYKNKFDFLFSIVNSHILRHDILNLPTGLSINYHSSLLPHYAGLYPPSWAILNDEKTHGVTWHIMNDKIDQGHILKQETIEIDPKETALSLNLKCYQRGLILFKELIQELEDNNFHTVAQDLSERTYNGLKQKPKGNGWISWESTAEEIDRLCRALNLGHYINQLSLPKIKIFDSVFTLEKYSLLQEKSEFSPGTLIKIDSNKWQISTKTWDILILELKTMEGKLCSLSNLAHYYNLESGDRLFSPTADELNKFEKISVAIAKSESFWVNQFCQFKSALLPFISYPGDISDKKEYICLDTLSLTTSLLQDLKESFPSTNLPEIMLTTFLVYLYRLGNKENLGIFLTPPHLEDKIQGHTGFFSIDLPFSISFKDDLTYAEALDITKYHYNLIIKKTSYLKDIYQRYPNLTNNEYYSQIKVVISDYTPSKLDASLNADIIIIISLDGSQISLLIDKVILDKYYVRPFIDNIPNHIILLLEQIIGKNTQKIFSLELLTAVEKQKILIDWNNTSTAYSYNKSIVDIFEEYSQKFPKSIAFIYKNQSLTYKTLNEKANQLAHYLKRQGLTLNARVVVSSDHDFCLIISILAILKAGGAYIPIDPSFPFEHIKNILDDSKPEMILTKEIYIDKLKLASKKNNVIAFEKAEANFKHEDKKNIYNENRLENPAYIIYTSGSTGKPKGVIIGQKSVVRLVKNTNYMDFKPDDRVAQVANISFDAATFEIWGALLNGASLVGIPKIELLSAVDFGNFLKKNCITILCITPVLFNELVSQNAGIFKNLNYLLMGGDVISKDKIKKLFECKDGFPKYILNGYGPTENTTATTMYLIKENSLQLPNIPAGKPISNTTVYVLDSYLQPVPMGVSGELYTGGAGVALGYLNNEELTNQKFIDDFFSGTGKLYKTGDRVRWLPDGDIEFLERIDKQVKVRGYRVEIEGIQQTLLQNNNIMQCVIVPNKNILNENHLIAYLVPQKNRNVDILTIKKELSKSLPDYMIPGFFIVIDKIPFTHNGKIDYKRLPPPERNNIEFQFFYVPCRNEIERELANIWSELLSIKKIGRLDDFFALGGHSLLLTKLILEIKRKFKFDLNIHDFLKFPTIANLARIIYNEKDLTFEDLGINKINDDVKWVPSIIPENKHSIFENKKAILLTGCTGFLGAHLLNSLYNTFKGDIYCLIRSNSIDEAYKKLEFTLKKYHLNVNLKTNIKLILCDISKPCLGISPDTFLDLADKIETIYHNAAHVNHIYSYETLRSENVLSTIEIIKLATLSKLKEIHYISSLSAVIGCKDEKNNVIENFVSSSYNTCDLSDGYNQTKWVSERILNNAHAKGVPVKIYRPGWILGDKNKGIISPDKNHLLLLIKGCVQLGFAPDWEMNLNILPVDFLSNAIIKISLDKRISNNVFNFVNPHIISWKNLIKYINKAGYKISLINSNEWRNEYLMKIDETNALFNLLPLHMSFYEDWIQNISATSKVNDSNTLIAFDKLNLSYPRVSYHLLKIYISFLQNIGFI